MFNNIFLSKKSSNKFEISDYVFLVAGLTIFTIIAFINITKSSIWFDEAFGAYLIQFNFIDIARYTAADVHPPLFYWLLKLWSELFGNTEFALRSMSVFFGAIAIIFGYLLTKRLFNKNAARVGLLFMILSPMLIRYSQEARMYTLVAAIALAATYTLTFAINSKKRLPWIIYGILIGLGMWVHYFSAIVWISHWVWRADIVRRIAKKGHFIKEFFSKEWIMAHVVAIILFLPWLPFFAMQILVIQVFGFWIPPATPDTMINFATNIFYYLDVGDATGWLAIGIIILICLVSVLAVKTYKTLDEFYRKSYRLIMALAFVPMILLFLMSMPPLRPAFIDRYLISSVIGISLFIGITFALHIKQADIKWRFVMVIFVVGIMAVGISNVYRLGNYNKNSHASNNTRQIIEAIDSKSSDGQPIIAITPWLFYEAVYYSTNAHPVYFIDQKIYKFGSLDMLRYNDQHKIKDMSSFTQKNPIIWYVGYIHDSGNFSAPYVNWKPIQEVTVNDSISGEPSYKAIQYRTDN